MGQTLLQYRLPAADLWVGLSVMASSCELNRRLLLSTSCIPVSLLLPKRAIKKPKGATIVSGTLRLLRRFFAQTLDPLAIRAKADFPGKFHLLQHLLQCAPGKPAASTRF